MSNLHDYYNPFHSISFWKTSRLFFSNGIESTVKKKVYSNFSRRFLLNALEGKSFFGPSTVSVTTSISSRFFLRKLFWYKHTSFNTLRDDNFAHAFVDLANFFFSEQGTYWRTHNSVYRHFSGAGIFFIKSSNFSRISLLDRIYLGRASTYFENQHFRFNLTGLRLLLTPPPYQLNRVRVSSPTNKFRPNALIGRNILTNQSIFDFGGALFSPFKLVNSCKRTLSIYLPLNVQNKFNPPNTSNLGGFACRAIGFNLNFLRLGLVIPPLKTRVLSGTRYNVYSCYYSWVIELSSPTTHSSDTLTSFNNFFTNSRVYFAFSLYHRIRFNLPNLYAYRVLLNSLDLGAWIYSPASFKQANAAKYCSTFFEIVICGVSQKKHLVSCLRARLNSNIIGFSLLTNNLITFYRQLPYATLHKLLLSFNWDLNSRNSLHDLPTLFWISKRRRGLLQIYNHKQRYADLREFNYEAIRPISFLLDFFSVSFFSIKKTGTIIFSSEALSIKVLFYARRFLKSFLNYNRLLQLPLLRNSDVNNLNWCAVFFKNHNFVFTSALSGANTTPFLLNLLGNKINAPGNNFLLEEFASHAKLISTLLQFGAGLRHSEFFSFGTKSTPFSVTPHLNARFLNPLTDLDARAVAAICTFNSAFFDNLSSTALEANFGAGSAIPGRVTPYTAVPSWFDSSVNFYLPVDHISNLFFNRLDAQVSFLDFAKTSYPHLRKFDTGLYYEPILITFTDRCGVQRLQLTKLTTKFFRLKRRSSLSVRRFRRIFVLNGKLFWSKTLCSNFYKI